MFSFYGRKKRHGHLYPEAEYNTIVEPFAGSAAYASRPENRWKKVILVESDPKVAEVWCWLQSQTKASVEEWPIPEIGERTTNYFYLLHAVSRTRLKSLKTTVILQKNLLRTQRELLETDALDAIQRWTIIRGDYTDAPEVEATWFIDPPYQGYKGGGYPASSDDLNYASLGRWCRNRKGQVVVCEGEQATWLPFEQLTDSYSFTKTHEEWVWVRGRRKK